MQRKLMVSALVSMRLWTLLFVVVLLYSACNSDEKPVASSGNFKMNCLVLKKDKLQEWLDKAKAKKKLLKLLLLQFHSKNTAEIFSNMQEMAYPGTSGADFGYWGNDLLEIDTTCVAVEFKEATFANNLADLSTMKIINPDTTLTDFDFIRFKPSAKYSPLISYDVEIVRIALKSNELTGTTNPCPPCKYCIPPCDE